MTGTSDSSPVRQFNFQIEGVPPGGWMAIPSRPPFSASQRWITRQRYAPPSKRDAETLRWQPLAREGRCHRHPPPAPMAVAPPPSRQVGVNALLPRQERAAIRVAGGLHPTVLKLCLAPRPRHFRLIAAIEVTVATAFLMLMMDDHSHHLRLTRHSFLVSESPPPIFQAGPVRLACDQPRTLLRL